MEQINLLEKNIWKQFEGSIYQRLLLFLDVLATQKETISPLNIAKYFHFIPWEILAPPLLQPLQSVLGW